MAARVKKRAGTSTNRKSDKIIVRLPEGMRHALAELAARNGRSMNAEVVAALAMYFAKEEAAKQDQLLGEAAIRELLANQQQTLELLKKIIAIPIAPQKVNRSIAPKNAEYGSAAAATWRRCSGRLRHWSQPSAARSDLQSTRTRRGEAGKSSRWAATASFIAR